MESLKVRAKGKEEQNAKPEQDPKAGTKQANGDLRRRASRLLDQNEDAERRRDGATLRRHRKVKQRSAQHREAGAAEVFFGARAH